MVIRKWCHSLDLRKTVVLYFNKNYLKKTTTALTRTTPRSKPVLASNH